MTTCLRCGLTHELQRGRDYIFHFRLMVEMVCLYSVCPECDFVSVLYYGDLHERLIQHAEIIEIKVWSVPTEEMIEGYRGLFGGLWLDPRELTAEDLKLVRKFRDELRNEKKIQHIFDVWGEE